MSKERKVLTERDFKKKWQVVYTFTPSDLRFLLVGAGIDKERIEMAHIKRYGHEWLDITIDCEDGWVSVPFNIYGVDEENNIGTIEESDLKKWRKISKIYKELFGLNKDKKRTKK